MNEFNAKTFLMCITVFLMTNSAVAQYNPAHQEIINDLPKNTDFEYYLKILEKAVDFCVKNERYVSINLKFGLFMLDLNLRHAMQQQLPVELKSRLKDMFTKNDALSAYFHKSIEKKKKNVTELESELTTVFYNASVWLSPDKFNVDLLNKTVMYSKAQLEMFYGKYETYLVNVSNYENYTPTPKQSDECVLDLLAKGPRFQRSWPNCVATPHCRKLVVEGSDYGYGLTHRMLFMVFARFYRKCVVFDAIEDKERMDALCSIAFNEAQYIAANYFQSLDLMTEQITLCGLMGHAQFYRNYWLKTIAQFQTPDGCFMEDDNSNQTAAFKNMTSDELMTKQCNSHFTAVGIAAISSALRHILENSRFY